MTFESGRGSVGMTMRCSLVGAVWLAVLAGAGTAGAQSLSEASPLTSCAPATLGTGSSVWQYVMYTYYARCRTQSLYLAEEIGDSGSITALSLNVTSIPGQDMNMFTIRMKHVTQSVLAAYLDAASGFTTVYQGTEPIGVTGWRTFTFSAPFAYDNTKNLMIDISYNNTTSTTGTNGYCASTTFDSTDYRTVRRYADTGDPLAWVGSTSAQRGNVRPNVRLTLCTPDGPPNPPTDLGTGQVTANAITWTWTDASNNEDGFRAYDTSDAQIWSAAANASSHEETGLTPNTSYTRRLRAYNGSGSSNPTDDVAVYTLPVPPNVVCNRQIHCPSYDVNTAFTFTSLAAFGGTSLDHYSYSWYHDPTYVQEAAESSWASGTLQLIADVPGNWYLQVSSHNPDHEVGAIQTLGPFVVTTVPGYAAGDINGDCAVDLLDLDRLIDCATGAGIPQTSSGCAGARLDGDADVDLDDFAVLQRCLSPEGVPADLNCE